MSINIFEEFTKYLNPEENKAFKILTDFFGVIEIENIPSMVEEQMPKLLDLSFNELCNEIRSGSFFLKLYEIISQIHDQEKVFDIDQLKDYPSVETVRDVSIKIFTWVVVKVVYEGYGLNDALEVLCYSIVFFVTT